MSQAITIRRTDSPFNDPVQSCRFVEVEDKWFFLTREKALQGPYATRVSAETALEIYLSEFALDELDSQLASISPQETPSLESYSVEELRDSVQEKRLKSWHSWKR